MDLIDGLILGIGGTLLTIVLFYIALWIGTHDQEKENQLEEDNPITRFWRDFRNK